MFVIFIKDNTLYFSFKAGLRVPGAPISGHDGAVPPGERDPGQADDDQVRGRLQRIEASEVRLRVGKEVGHFYCLKWSF